MEKIINAQNVDLNINNGERKLKNKEIECPNCNKKIIPITKLNRVKSEFYGSTYTGKDKLFWLICPNCKKIIGQK